MQSQHHNQQDSTKKMKSFRQAVALLVALSTGSSAFAPASNARGRSALSVTTKEPPKLPDDRSISYGEESRKYRRTVYTHDDWVKHRSPDRFTRNLFSVTSSGVYKNLAKEVLATTSVATLLVLWNCVFGGYTDFEGIKHAAVINSFLPTLALPLAPFTISSPSLGLLLGKFRHSAVFQYSTEILCTLSHPILNSLPHQHLVPAMGRSSKELGYEH
jgi:hypothetical protein